jgi:hypothetical protein
MKRKLVCFFVFVLCAVNLHAQTVDSTHKLIEDILRIDTQHTMHTDTTKIPIQVPAGIETTDTVKTKNVDTVRKQDPISAAPMINPNYPGYQIAGTVKDDTDGQPVPFATVFFEKSAIGTSTDENGNFILQFDKFPADSIKVQVIGYNVFAKKVDKSKRVNTYELVIERSSAFLDEVIIKPGEDPAITLMKEVIRSKEKNDPDQVQNYKYESYNKVEIDLLNFTRKKFERLPVPYLKRLGFIFDNVDSASYEKPFLPMYLTGNANEGGNQ